MLVETGCRDLLPHRKRGLDPVASGHRPGGLRQLGDRRRLAQPEVRQCEGVGEGGARSVGNALTVAVRDVQGLPPRALPCVSAEGALQLRHEGGHHRGIQLEALHPGERVRAASRGRCLRHPGRTASVAGTPGNPRSSGRCLPSRPPSQHANSRAIYASHRFLRAVPVRAESLYAARERRRNTVDGTRHGKLGLGVWALIIALISLVVLTFLPTPYVIQRPGPVYDTLGTAAAEGGEEVPLIKVEGAETFETAGSLDLTTVQVVGNRERTPQLVRARPRLDGLLARRRAAGLRVPRGGHDRAARRARRGADGRLAARGDRRGAARARLRHGGDRARGRGRRGNPRRGRAQGRRRDLGDRRRGGLLRQGAAAGGAGRRGRRGRAHGDPRGPGAPGRDHAGGAHPGRRDGVADRRLAEDRVRLPDRRGYPARQRRRARARA